MTDTTLIDRAVIRLSGEDVRGFLQGLVTNDTAGDLPAWAALLSPQGKALFDFILWADGEDVLIDCEADQAEAIVRRLSMYRLRRKIVIARDQTLAVHWAQEGDGPLDPRLPELGHRWIAPAAAPAHGWKAHRLSLGVTEGVTELGSDKTLWLECNAGELNGVSFTKGCYVGQENTARMNYRQKINRRLVVVKTDTDPGDAAMVFYPEFGLAVARVRVEALGAPLPMGVVIVPDWLKAALA
ncbi:YgfZ/GcvT domain-containing protein [Sphingobium boeckii]|uniref:Aminomethyltransferase folate-binding domain-containing protein n=1 Tax=Sphingobium boeckii TaxID=1082345 RepID=A0A7W9AJI2_9SPHN|nr:folate-binding protein YgfZ [Sphingobium boeckii]MBB5686858.1 hypothetical protein [Sphingobium boeckii]